MNFKVNFRTSTDPWCCGVIPIGGFELIPLSLADKDALRLAGWVYPKEASPVTVTEFSNQIRTLPQGRLVQCTTKDLGDKPCAWSTINSALRQAGFVEAVNFRNSHSGNNVILWTYKT